MRLGRPKSPGLVARFFLPPVVSSNPPPACQTASAVGCLRASAAVSPGRLSGCTDSAGETAAKPGILRMGAGGRFVHGARPGGEPAARRQELETVRWGHPPQEGGGSASASGTTGSGDSIVRRSRWVGQVEVALAGGAHDAGQHLLRVGAFAGAVAAADLASDHRGPDGLLGAPVGGLDRRVAQEEEHGREFVGQMLGEALGVGQRRRRVDQPAEPGGESAAGRRQTVLADVAGVAAVPQGEVVSVFRTTG